MKHTIRFAGLGLATLLTFGGPSAHASVIAEETFSYASGSSLAGQSGGFGWSGSWSNSAFGDMTIGGSSLSYTGLTTSGGDAVGGGSGSNSTGTSDKRSLAAASNTDGSVVWLAFLGVFKSDGGGFPNVRLVNGSGTMVEAVGGNNNYTDWSVMGSGLTSSTFTTTPLNTTTALALLKIDYTTGTSSLWMDPILSTFNGTQTPSMTLAAAPTFSQVQIFTRTGDSIDEIRLATTYQEAVHEALPAPSVPEPPTPLLLAAGVIGTAALRRQRRAP